MAQSPVLKRPDVRLGLRALVIALAAIGAQGVAAQTVRITPSVQTQLTWTDNVEASRDKSSDWVAEVSPGIAISRAGGRVSGSLNAQFRNMGHAQQTERNTSYLALSGRGQIEAVERMLFLDVDANISRNNLSVFNGRAQNDEFNVSKDNETRTWSLKPRFEYALGDARGSIAYTARWLESGGSAINTQRLEQWAAQLGDSNAGGLFGWGVNYNRIDTESDDSLSRSASQQTGRATLFINVSPQVRLRAIGGYESNDYESSGREEGAIYGAGIDWNPTSRTTLSATVEDRIFGRGYDFTFKHRFARAAWDLGYNRDYSSSLQELGDNPARLQAEAICLAIIGATDIPSPGPLLDFYDQCLAVQGFSRLGARGFVSNSTYLSESWRVGVSLNGVRNTLSFSLQQSDRTRLSALSGLSAEDDFAQTTRIKTTTATLSYSHSLSGFSSLNSSLSRSRSTGDDASGLETLRWVASVGLTTRLGPRTTAGLNYRYQRADGAGRENDFTENAVTANLGMTF